MLLEQLLNQSQSNKIGWIYKPPQDIQKQIIDFYILSLIYRYNQRKKSNYYKSPNLNKELEFILTDAVQKSTNSQKRMLIEILSSIIVIENKDLDSDITKEIGSMDQVYLQPEYHKKINSLIKKNKLDLESIAQKGIQNFNPIIKNLSLSLKSLLNCKDINTTIIIICDIYDILKSDLKIIDKLPEGKLNWKSLFSLLNVSSENIWNIFRYSSIPQRIIGYFVKYKGFENREDIFDKKTIDTRNLENIKAISEEFLSYYLISKEKKIRSSLIEYKAFSNLSPQIFKRITNEESIKTIVYDIIYNNKRIKERPLDKLDKPQTDIINPFNPFRFYEYKERKEFAIRLDDTSRFRKILEDFMDVKEIPYSVFISIDSDLLVQLRKFIEIKNLIVPPESKIGELEELEYKNLI